MVACLNKYTGTVDDECSVGTEDRDWYAYWRLLFAQVHESDIVDFETKYKGNFYIYLVVSFFFSVAVLLDYSYYTTLETFISFSSSRLHVCIVIMCC